MLTKQMRELERQHEVVTYKTSPEDSTPTIESHVESFVAKVNSELKGMYSERHEGVTAPTIEIQWCTKLARLVTGNSVWGFIALRPGAIGGVSYTTGDLMKAASWRGPAKHSRGNILDNTAAYGMYGPTYLKK